MQSGHGRKEEDRRSPTQPRQRFLPAYPPQSRLPDQAGRGAAVFLRPPSRPRCPPESATPPAIRRRQTRECLAYSKRVFRKRGEPCLSRAGLRPSREPPAPERSLSLRCGRASALLDQPETRAPVRGPTLQCRTQTRRQAHAPRTPHAHESSWDGTCATEGALPFGA